MYDLQIEALQPADSCVIWLHGLGAGSSDFEPVARMLQKTLPATRFILPQAPMRAMTVNGGYTMPSWYDILRMEHNIRQVNLLDLNQSCDHIINLLEQQIAQGIPAQRLVLAGFSQGGAVTLHTAFRRWDRPLAAVLALSTYAPDFPPTAQYSTHKHPTLCMHGTQDDVVSPELGKAAFAQLQQLQQPVTWHDYPMQHEVCLSQIKDIARFLQTHLIETA
ncbi:alpha/beta hydrolase [Pseudomonas sp. F1_0610]|uniref:alpha/beta hydrolase n=1 Tax=Pseudomonas sp. F1_0610 TaxID=3114284 RepID=UPI0039C0E6FD